MKCPPIDRSTTREVDTHRSGTITADRSRWHLVMADLQLEAAVLAAAGIPLRRGKWGRK